MSREALRHHALLGTVTHCGKTEIFVNANLLKSEKNGFVSPSFELALSHINGHDHHLALLMSSLTEEEREKIVRPLVDKYVEHCFKKGITPSIDFLR